MSERLENIDDDSVYYRKIEDDTNICSSCYRKIREIHDPHPRMPDVVDSHMEYEPDVGHGYFDDFKQTGRISQKKAYCVCGAVEWDDIKLRPLDVEQMIAAAERISNRLEEKDVEHEREELISRVESLAPLPEYQFREEEVFEEAVDSSVVNND